MTDAPPTSAKSHMPRVLTVLPLTMFGIAYMSPPVVVGSYGVMVTLTHGLATTAYLVALVAMLFTAASYGRMVQAYPTSGSAYTYVGKTLGPKVGFLTGWTLLLDYLFLPMAVCVFTALNLQANFPAVPIWVWVVALVLVISVINLRGIKFTGNSTLWMMLFSLAVIVVFVVLMIVNANEAGKPLVTAEPFWNEEFSWPAVLAGAAIACYSFLGFDAVSTLSEEAVEPRRSVPRATVLATLLGGVLFMIVSYFGQIVHPSTEYKSEGTAGYELVAIVGGNVFSAIFLVMTIVCAIAAGVTMQASVSRVLYTMGRDGVLPHRIFGKLSPRTLVPTAGILISAAVCMLAIVLDARTSVSFINFGAFAAFALVNVSVIVHYLVRERRRGVKAIILFGAMPTIGLVFDVILLSNLDSNALVLGGIWLALGIIYLTWLTRGFTRQPPSFAGEATTEEPVAAK